MKSLVAYLFVGVLTLMGTRSEAQQMDSIPAHATFTLQSQPLGETRVVHVWLPPAYASGSASFPVLYMLDGGLKEDFPHVANTLAELLQAHQIPPVLLVGIENTQRRRDLTGPTEVKQDQAIAPVVGGSALFRTFIASELMPEIEKRYRTNGKKAIIGESLAGLFITETFLLKPNLFDVYIAFDPSLWWNDRKLLKEAAGYVAQLPSTPKVFWFAASGAKGIYGNARTLAAVLKKAAVANLSWEHVPRRREKHHTIFRATKVKGLIWALNKL